jgi:hypothetical protein
MAKRLFLYVIFISVFFMPVLVQADINDELLKLKKQIPLIEMKVDKDIGPIIQKNVVLDDEISVLEEKDRRNPGHKLVQIQIKKQIIMLRNKKKANLMMIDKIQMPARNQVIMLEKKIAVLEQNLKNQVAREEALKAKKAKQERTLAAKQAAIAQKKAKAQKIQEE